MKKTLIVTAVALVILVALGVAGFAFAQSQTPDFPYGMMNGQGMMGRSGIMGGNNMMNGKGMMGAGNHGAMHEYMVASLAKGLGLSTDEFQARIDAGETPYQIAQSAGLNEEQIRELMSQAHDDALQAAVDAGEIDPEQADWMDQHMEQMWQNAGGAGTSPCHGGSATNTN